MTCTENGTDLEEGWIKDHFLLNTKGFCFICFKVICSQLGNDDDGDVQRITRGRGGERDRTKRFKESPPATETFSLHSLCHHLKLDVLKILSTKVSSMPIPAEVVSSLEKSDWRVTMCQTCGGMAARFSKLLRQLEILRMEVGHCLEVMQEWIEEANKDANVKDQFHKSMASDIQSLLYLGIVNELRKEVSRKCSVTAQPKVTLERLVENKAGGRSTTNVTKVVTRSGSNAIKIKQNDLDKLLLDTIKTPTDGKLASSLPLIAEDTSSVTLSPSLQSEKRSSPSPTLAPAKEAASEADISVRHLRSQSQGKRIVNGNQPTTKMNCNFCQQNFDSGKEVKAHFAKVHLPSMKIRLATQSEQNELISVTQNKGSVPSTPEPELVKITDSVKSSETAGPSKRDDPTTAAPCKITQVFQIGSACKRAESPVKVVYVSERSSIASVPSVSSHSKTTSLSNNNKKPSVSPDKGDHVCKDCGLKFTYEHNLTMHINSVHKKRRNARKSPVKVNPQTTAGIDISEMETRPKLTTTTLSGSRNREQERAINDDDTEIETACIEMTSSTPNDNSQYVSTHWVDPLSDVSISDMMDTSNNFKTLGVATLQMHHPPETSAHRMHNSTEEPSAIQVYNLPGPSTLQMYSSLVPPNFQMYNSPGPSNLQIYSSPGPSNLQMYNPAVQPSTLQSYNPPASSTVQVYTQPVPAATLQVYNQPPGELGMYMSAPSSTTTSAQYYGLPPPVEASFSIHSTSGVPECRLCGKQFADLNGFQNHYNEDHLILPFACSHNHCDKSFADHMSLRNHCEKFHGVQQDMVISTTELPYPATGYTQNPVTTNTTGPNSFIPITIILPGNQMNHVQMGADLNDRVINQNP